MKNTINNFWKHPLTPLLRHDSPLLLLLSHSLPHHAWAIHFLHLTFFYYENSVTSSENTSVLLSHHWSLANYKVLPLIMEMEKIMTKWRKRKTTTKPITCVPGDFANLFPLVRLRFYSHPSPFPLTTSEGYSIVKSSVPLLTAPEDITSLLPLPRVRSARLRSSV